MSKTDFRLGPAIERVTILKSDAAGRATPAVLYERKGKPQRETRQLKPVGRAVRQAVEAFSVAADSYLARHQSSLEKERDGWLLEMPGNVFRAARKGSKRMKLGRVISMPA